MVNDMFSNLIKKTLSAVLILILLLSMLPLSAVAMTITRNAIGSYQGWDYEFWSQIDDNGGSMTLTGGGTYTCEWTNTFNILFRMGRKLGSTKPHNEYGIISIDYEADYNITSGDVSYLCVYGWTRNPLVEFYVVESRGSYNPGSAGTHKGTLDVDGSIYDIYEATRINQPSIDGTRTFQQYFSVRRNMRTEGVISLSEHFKAWENLGMPMNGNMYEVSLCVEGFQSSGNANIKKHELTFIEPPVYDSSISLSQTSAHTFSAATFGYSAGARPPALPVTVKNTGNAATDSMSVTISGENDSSFTLGTSTTDPLLTVPLTSLPVGSGTRTFDVRPMPGLDAGTHTATVTVSGDKVEEQSFDVVFTVNKRGGAATRTAAVANINTDAAARTPTSLKVTNTAAVAPTDENNIAKQDMQFALTTSNAGTMPSNLIWSTSKKNNITGVWDDVIFDGLRPSTEYYIWARTAANDNSNAGEARRSGAIKTLAPEFDITLSRQGTTAALTTHTFKAANVNYTARTAQAIRVTNIGTKPTDSLFVSLSGFDNDKFEIVTPDDGILPSLSSNSRGEFTIRPIDGLTVGTYTTTVTVSNANISRSFNVSFTVNRGSGAAVSGKPAESELAPPTGTTITAHELTRSPMAHPGNQSVEYAITTNNASKMPSGLIWQSSPVFENLQPLTRYFVWARTAANENSAAGSSAKRSDAIWTTQPDYSIMLCSGTKTSALKSHTFGSASRGYSERTPALITVRNTGLNDTDQLSVSISGIDEAHKDAFEIIQPAAPYTIGIIPAKGTASFRIRPALGLESGIYNATVTVSGGSGATAVSESFNVSFTVKKSTGSALTGPATISSSGGERRTTSLTVRAPNLRSTATGQSVEYAITTSTSSKMPNNLIWQNEPEFTNLSSLTTYRVWARTAENATHSAGKAVRSAAFRTGGITLSGLTLRSGVHTISSAPYITGNRNLLRVTVANHGTVGTGELDIKITDDKGVLTNIFEIVTPASSKIGNVSGGGKESFEIRPKAGLLPGTYNATVSISGNNGFDNYLTSFNIRFSVNRTPGSALSRAPSMASRTANSITINNNVSLSRQSGQKIMYAITTSTSSSLPSNLVWQEGLVFSNLRSGTRHFVWARAMADDNNAAGPARRSAAMDTLGLMFANHAIRLNRSGVHVFSTAGFDYSARSALSVTVNNLGSQATDVMTISLSGANPGSFEIVSPIDRTLASISGKNETTARKFSIRPKTGLAIGTYQAVVTVNTAGGASTSFRVSFTVAKATGSAVNSVPFAAQVTSERIEVRPVIAAGINPGKQTVEYAIGKTTTPPSDPALWKTDRVFENLDPMTNYYVFARTRSTTTYNSGEVRRSAVIRTDYPDQGITLSRTTPYVFTAATYGYALRPAFTVTLSNIGKFATGELTISLIGNNPGSFIKSPAGLLDNFPINASQNITIRPAQGLSAGDHTATLVVSGGIGADAFEASLDLSFTVGRAAGFAVAGVPTAVSRTSNSITVVPLTAAGSNPMIQDVEYAIATGAAVPPTAAWGDSNVFTNLNPSTTYYVFARTKENTNYNTGAVVRSAIIQTTT